MISEVAFKKYLKKILFEYVECGIIEVCGQSPDYEPKFRFTKKHLEKVVRGDKDYIRFLKDKLHIVNNEMYIDQCRKTLESYSEQTMLH